MGPDELHMVRRSRSIHITDVLQNLLKIIEVLSTKCISNIKSTHWNDPYQDVILLYVLPAANLNYFEYFQAVQFITNL